VRRPEIRFSKTREYGMLTAAERRQRAKAAPLNVRSVF